MANNESSSDNERSKSLDFKCEKCNKKVKTGVQCAECESSYHLRCANVSSALEESKWNCPSCGERRVLVSLIEVRCQQLERANLLLSGENAAYKKLHADLQEKYVSLVRRIDNLEKMMTAKTRSSECSQDSNPKNNTVVNNNSKNKSCVKQMPLPVITTAPVEKTEPNNIMKPSGSAPNKVINTINDGNQHQPQSLTNIATENEGFQLQKNKRSYRKPLIGKNSNSTALTAIPQSGWLHVCRLAQDTTTEKMLQFLDHARPGNAFTCEKLVSKGNYASFKIGYPLEIKDEINHPDFWPAGIAVRRFFLSARGPVRAT